MEPGTRVGDRFLIERRIASGGMGTVYRAEDRLSGEPVALKITHVADHARFDREARILAELRHPGLVRYVAHGVASDGVHWLAMEWLDGEDLEERLGRGPLGVRQALTVVRAAAEALTVAHERRIVHRDLKPSNLFLVGGAIERVKVLDFGVARDLESTAAMTRTGALLGTPGYLAPEQARGLREIDARADVFSLGCILFACLTGRPPFVGDGVMAVLAKILLEEAPDVSALAPDVPESVARLVEAMLAKAPDQRPADAATLVTAIDGLGERARRSSISIPALTDWEQRLVALVMAVPDSAPVDAATATTVVPGEGVQHEDMAALARAHGGRLEALANGSFLVLVTAAEAATDQAARAARCALALSAVLPDARVALATGRAEVSARRLVGEVIDRAAALVRATRPGAIRIDDATAGLLDDAFEVVGDADALALRRERDVAPATRTLLGKATPCVGRDRELVTLEALFRECAGERVARAVLVSGPPGIGKSRLRYEFLARLRAAGEPAEIVSGRGESLRAGSPFGVLAPALRRLAGIRDGEPAAVQQQKLRARVGRHVEPAQAQRTAEFLGELAAVPFPDERSPALRTARDLPQLMAETLRRVWLDWLAAEAAAQPIVFVLEDLHWGDQPTVQFLDLALAELHDRPIMVLALARPDVHKVFPGLWVERAVTEMRLGPLSRRAAEKLARAVLGDDAPAETVNRVVDTAGGNVFYLEELLRAVVEGSTALPTSVVAGVEARLEALPPDARRVLRAASVFGRSFWRGGVMALLGGERRVARLEEWLEDLTRREIVTRQPDSRFPSDVEYQFRHALVCDAAYGMLTDSDRRLGHRLAGEWLAAAGETDALELATHFERGDAPAQAATWFLAAGNRHLQEGQPEAALALLERAGELGIADAQVDGFLSGITRCHRYLARHRDALVWIERMLARAPSDAARAACLRWEIGIYRDYDTAAVLRRAGEALGAAERAGDEEAYAFVLSQAAFAAYRGGDVEQARRYAELASARSFARPTAIVLAMRARMFAATAAGDYERAGELSTELRERYLELADPGSAANECNNLAEAMLSIGRPDEAAAAAAQAEALAAQVDHRPCATFARVLGAAAAAERGELDAALQALEGLPALGGYMLRIDVGCLAARLLLRRGRPSDVERAREHVAEALPLARQASAGHALTALHALDAMALTRLGDPDGARDALARARAALGSADDAAHCQFAIAAAEVLSPEREERRTILAQARARLLAIADQRHDPRAFLEGVWLHRRLLEVSA